MNPRTRRTALYAIGIIAILASADALTHSCAGLYGWAVHHRLGGCGHRFSNGELRTLAASVARLDFRQANRIVRTGTFCGPSDSRFPEGENDCRGRARLADSPPAPARNMVSAAQRIRINGCAACTPMCWQWPRLGEIRQQPEGAIAEVRRCVQRGEKHDSSECRVKAQEADGNRCCHQP
jgi:hypothetical protein